MRRADVLSTRNFYSAALALLMAWAMAPASAQLVPLSALQLPEYMPQAPLSERQVSAGDFSHIDMEYLSLSVVEDWSTHHVVFSNPGTLEDAQRNGTEEHWWRIVSDPRYRMQWVTRYGAALRTPANAALVHPPEAEQQEQAVGEFRRRAGGRDRFGGNGKKDSIHSDWSVAIGASGANPGQGVGFDQYPAKFAFYPFFAPSCTNDYVVYPVANSASANANIVGVNNLYSGTCTTGTVPSVLFAYNLGTGSVNGSPVISLDGTKVAFVESLSTGSYLHVLTLDTSGNAGCGANPPTTATTPCNGIAYNFAVPACTVNTIKTAGASGPSSSTTTTPCTYNKAVDNRILIYPNGSTTSLTITRSSPFVDYTNDIAYLGDDNGNLHKFTPFFKFTTFPAEITTSGSWPACAGSFYLNSYCSANGIFGGGNYLLASPVYDSTSGLVLIGNSNGTLYADPYMVGGLSSYGFASKGQSPGSNIPDAPIVDSTAEKVFVSSSNGSNMILAQYGVAAGTTAGTSTSGYSGSAVTDTMGPSGIDAYRGAFDNAYLTSSNATGYMYFCGSNASGGVPAVMRVAITTGTMASSNDGKSFQLVSTTTPNSGTNYDCTPLTEFYNPNVKNPATGALGVDYLFAGVKNNGFNTTGVTNCGAATCVMSLSLATGYGTPSSSVAFPTGVMATATITPANSTLSLDGASGIIIDNFSTAAGAAQIYFGIPNNGTGVQMSQAALH
jgi:hypothetical protein